MLDLLIGTKDGIFLLRQEKGLWQPSHQHLPEQDIWVVASRPAYPRTLFAGSYGNGLFRSTDGGDNWTRVGEEDGIDYVRAITFSPRDPEMLYIGTEPANLYRSYNGGDSWTNLDIRAVEGSERWSLPYSPRAGAVRTIVFNPDTDGVIYAGVEQGGIVRSTNDGANWTINRDEVHPDVHMLAVHPLTPSIMFAATGGGLYRTTDGGQQWERVLIDYIRAVLIHPLNPDLVFAGPARHVGSGGRILFSEDGGDSWEVTGEGLPLPMEDMVERFVLDPNFPNHLFAIRSNGTLLLGRVDEVEWQPLKVEVPYVYDLIVVDSSTTLHNEASTPR